MVRLFRRVDLAALALAIGLGPVVISGAYASNSRAFPIATSSEQDVPQALVSDGTNGAYVSWIRQGDPSSPTSSLFVNRLSASGARAWTSDLLVSDDVNSARTSTMVTDG